MFTAFIRESECVGCTKCLDACPVDAIIGAPQFLHTVLAAECIGCELCVAPCPMDCIEMKPSSIEDNSTEKLALAQKAKSRYSAKKQRLIRNAPLQLPNEIDNPKLKDMIRTEIAESIKRVTAKRETLK